ncbi:MAG: glycosyltransferase family 92 protein [Chlamydiales bacterium]|nr:glycosyltransferase family 92 protein [Chlamydiales bacterium]
MKAIKLYLLFFILATTITGKIDAYELGIVSLFKNEANYLKEWIEYHRMVGVDHFLLYDNLSEDNWREVLAPYIEEGLVEVTENWGDPAQKTGFPITWQMNAFHDGLNKFKGKAKWVAFIDIDEFIMPKKHRKVTDCLDNVFSNASGIYVCWRNFGTNNIYIEPGKPIITRLTGCSAPDQSDNSVGKSIVRPDHVLHCHSPHFFRLLHDKRYYSGSNNKLHYHANGELGVPYTHTSRYLQVNHYKFRDERFYKERRLARLVNAGWSTALLEEHYVAFNIIQNRSMVNFLKKYHRNMYNQFWSNDN